MRNKSRNLGFILSIFLVLTIPFFHSCSKGPAKPERNQSSVDSISSFVFRSSDNSPDLKTDAIGIIGTDSISVTLPSGTNVTALKPFITSEGKTLSPANLASQDFTNPVTYTVTAADGSTKSYIVKVIIEPFPITGTVFVSGETDDGIVSTGNIFALDPSTGQPKWIYSSSRGIVSGPTVANGMVYDASKNGTFFALDVNTGKEVWQYSTNPTNQISSYPTVVNNVFYCGSADSFFYALNATNGSLIWKIYTGMYGSNSPTVSNGVVYFIGGMQYLYAVNSTSGTVLWKSQLSKDNPPTSYSNQAVVNGVLYIASSDRNLYAVDIATGKIKWTYFAGDVINSSPTVVDGIVYFTGGLSSVYAVNATTGSLEWSYYNHFSILSSPSVVKGTLYFGSQDQNLYALDAKTGVVKWTYKTDSYIGYSPLYYGGVIFISSTDEFYAINATTGNLLWKYFYEFSYAFINSCALDLSGNVYHTSESGDQN